MMMNMMKYIKQQNNYEKPTLTQCTKKSNTKSKKSSGLRERGSVALGGEVYPFPHPTPASIPPRTKKQTNISPKNQKKNQHSRSSPHIYKLLHTSSFNIPGASQHFALTGQARDMYELPSSSEPDEVVAII